MTIASSLGGLMVLLPSLLLASLQAEQEASRPMTLWPNGAPGAKGAEAEDIPSISLYRPPNGRINGAAIVICPGGGYEHLASYEGHDVALWLNSIAVTAVVLKYRLGPRYEFPAPMQDAARAIRTLRARAKEWGLDPNRIGIWGFSAGGHLASTLATHFDEGDAKATDPIERFSSRPDIAVLAYPVISMKDGITHAGSRRNLLGATPSPELVKLLSNETQVTTRTPPTFLFHTAEDKVVAVDNSLLFAEALRRAGVPYELHVFERGPHGVGLARDNPVLDAWPKLLVSWLRARGFIE